MEGLLVSLSTYSIFGGNTTVSAKMVLSKLIFLSCPFLSSSEPMLLGRKEGINNKTPCSRLLRMHSLLQCMLEADDTPWKQRGLLMAFPFSHKVFGTLGVVSILKNLSCDEICRCLHAFQ